MLATHSTTLPRARRRLVSIAALAAAATASSALLVMSPTSHASAAPVRAEVPRPTHHIVGLEQGATGDGVKSVQQALIGAGINLPGGADGVFGPATAGAVSAFQRREGLDPTGKVDQPTATKLGLGSSDPAPSAAPAPVANADAFVGMQIGAQGDAVTQLQNRLMDTGVYVPGGADGTFGPATERALSQFQRWNDLKETGTVTQAVVKALQLGSPSGAAAPRATNETPANPYVGLKIGANGGVVQRFQQALIEAGIRVAGGADGAFGPATQSALQEFQRREGREATGVVTEADVGALGLGAETVNQPAQNGYIGLKVGANGDLVKGLQQALIDAGISVPGGADGAFGPATEGALRSYQERSGLEVTGAVNDATARKLGLGTASNGSAGAPSDDGSHPYAGLAIGAQGDKVKELQRALIRTGMTLRGGADGVFGNFTRTTLQAFQRQNDIEPTGVLTAKGARILGLGSGSGQAQGATAPAGYPIFGERGDRVRSLQQRLLNAGISFNGGADGHFGAATAGAIMDFQRREGLRVTGKVDDTTANALGLSKAPAPPPPSSNGIQLEVFPMQGPCWFGDTWHAPRSGGRLHEGVDIIGDEGKLLYAVVDGTISRQYFDYPGALAGNGLRLTQPNGTYFTYLHLSDFAPGIETGVKVKAGDVIGYNGNTGNSATAHLHFEIHPNGGAAINPYPFVRAIDACDVTAPRS